MIVGSNTNRMVLCNCEPQLPPKIKESERMLMIQRWVNNLPMPFIVEFIRNYTGQNGKAKTKEEYAQNSCCRCGALNPLPPPMGDDPEMVPPPGRIYSARAPFTNEDHIIFSSSGSAHHVQQTILNQQNLIQKFYCNHNHHSNELTSCSTLRQQNNQFSCNSSKYNLENNHSNLNDASDSIHNQNRSLVNHPHNHRKNNYSARSSPSPPSRKYQKLSMNKKPYKESLTNEQSTSQLNQSKFLTDSQSKDTRHFNQLETKLVVELFEDFFHSGDLPSLAEVRTRIASTLLVQTRSAVSVRSKIKRLNSSGSWTQYKKG